MRSLQHFGHASVPSLGSRIVLVRRGGNRLQSIAVASNHNDSRLQNLKPGDSALYDVRGTKLKMTEAGHTLRVERRLRQKNADELLSFCIHADLLNHWRRRAKMV